MGLGDFRLTATLIVVRVVYMEDTDYDIDTEGDDFDYGWEDDAYMAQYDDDPNPYHGDYSEC